MGVGAEKRSGAEIIGSLFESTGLRWSYGLLTCSNIFGSDIRVVDLVSAFGR